MERSLPANAGPTMTRPFRRASLLAVLAVVLLHCHTARAGDPTWDYRTTIDKGLAWLVSQQSTDGHWDVNGQYPTAMTAFAGLALLADGNTLADGRYSHHLWKSVQWHMKRAQSNGLLADPVTPGEGGRYMLGHGFALLFLSQVYLIETDEDRRDELGKLLAKAVEFSAKAQTSCGGWGYVSAKDGSDFDEGNSTQCQLQGLLAAGQAGFPAPQRVLDGVAYYLQHASKVIVESNDPRQIQAGLVYSLTGGGCGNARPVITINALAAQLHIGKLKDPLHLHWLNFCQEQLPLEKESKRSTIDTYGEFWMAQVAYALGDDRHALLRPDLAEQEKDSGKQILLTWRRFQSVVLSRFAKEQKEAGRWEADYLGPVFTTSLRLIVLQLDRENVPWFGR